MNTTKADVSLSSSPRGGIGSLIRRRPETITFALLVTICVAVSIANPAFLQPSTLIDMAVPVW